MIFVLYALTGALAGFCSGLLGIGGGIILVPALSFIFLHYFPIIPRSMIMHVTIATSLAVMIVTTMTSAYAHHRHQSVYWPMWRKWLPGLLLGTLSGVLIARNLSFEWLRWIFAGFLMLIALKMVLRINFRKVAHLPGKKMAVVVGMVVGGLSGLLGVGGGVMMVPYLNRNGLTMAKAAGTATASSLPIAILGALSYILVGWQTAQGIPHCIGYVYWPAFVAIVPTIFLMAPVGAKLAQSLPSALLKNVFSLCLVAIAMHMFLG